MRSISVFLLASVICAQSPTHENKGKPIQITGSCKADDLGILGLSCTASEPCPLFLELSGVEQVGNRLIVTGNLHTNSATVESVLLASENDGLTWIEPAARIPGAVLDELQFIDFESGWISGHLLLPKPRDPFFLLSTDGGKTWRRRPMSGEPAPGAIQSFRFDSKQHGLVVLDRLYKTEAGMRYEVYESMTSGESWMLQRVTDKPVALKSPESAPRAFRIRIDSPSKSFRVERRNGAAWTSLATFAVAAGECKVDIPPEPEAPAPPEETPPVEPGPKPPPSLGKKGKP